MKTIEFREVWWLAAAAGALLAAPGAALAQEPQGEAGEACPTAERVEPRAIEGRVTRTDTLTVEGDDHVLAWVTTPDGEELTVDLGPADALDPIEVAADDTITAEGPVYRFGDHHVVVASRLSADGREASIERGPSEQEIAAYQQQMREEREARAQAQAEPRGAPLEDPELQALLERGEPIDVNIVESAEEADVIVAVVEENGDLQVQLGQDDLRRARAELGMEPEEEPDAQARARTALDDPELQARIERGEAIGVNLVESAEEADLIVALVEENGDVRVQLAEEDLRQARAELGAQDPPIEVRAPEQAEVEVALAPEEVEVQPSPAGQGERRAEVTHEAETEPDVEIALAEPDPNVGVSAGGDEGEPS